MKAPRFWQKTSSPLSYALMPLAWLYGAVVQHRAQQPPAYTATIPVICIGNATMGGSGKTPVVQAIAQILREQGHNPAILLRGYGGMARGPLWVDGQDAQEVGDEALLHARIAKTMVARDRVAGAKLIAQDSTISHIIMDDGLQNSSLDKTLSLLVVDGENPQSNGRIFPAGPLRETMANAARRVQGIIMLGEDKTGIDSRFTCPVIAADLLPVNKADFAGKNVFAFAGIGRPEKFFASLRQCGAVVAGSTAFPDHHFYTNAELAAILHQAAALQGIPVTTRKDWVRLPPILRDKVQILDVMLAWHNLQEIKVLLPI